jgi:hypothetical protein
MVAIWPTARAHELQLTPACMAAYASTVLIECVRDSPTTPAPVLDHHLAAAATPSPATTNPYASSGTGSRGSTRSSCERDMAAASPRVWLSRLCESLVNAVSLG